MAKRKLWVLWSVAATFGALPLSADWLVTTDGGRIETRGAWRVEGNRVLFTLKNGSLGILRKNEVDLDASAVATAQAQAPPPKAPEKPAPKKPVMSLTDKDVPTYVEAPAAAPNPAQPANAPAQGAAPAAQPLVVEGWEKVDGADGGLEITGVLRNRGDSFESGLNVTVIIVDAQGNVQEAMGFVSQAGLLPGTTTSFRAVFPNAYDLSGEPTFRLSSSGAKIGSPVSPQPDEGSNPNQT